MITSVFFNMLFTFFCVSFMTIVHSQELQPIRAGPGGSINGLHKRAPQLSDLDLSNDATFLWADPTSSSSDAVANLTVLTPGSDEHILNMERFYPMLKDIDCTNTSMTFKFIDKDSFAYAQKVWDWVNGADNHSFIMVAGAGDCAWNTDRQPFLVSKITYNADNSVAHLKARAVEWHEIVHTYDLEVGSIEDTGVADLQARDTTKSLTRSIAHKFTPSKKWSKGDLDLELSCADCHTAGSVRFGLRVKVSWDKFIEGYISLNPLAVSAYANLQFGVTGTLAKDVLAKEITPVTIPLTPITIGTMLIVGPELSFGIGAKISDFVASADFTLGAQAQLAQAPYLKIDLLDPSKSTFKGWMPTVKMIQPSVNGKITTTATMYAKVSLNMDAVALSQGWKIGIAMTAPKVEVELSALASTKGACPSNSPPLHELGVEGKPSVGADLSVQLATKKNPAKPIWSHTLALMEPKSLPGFCLDFGPLVKDPKPTTTSSKPATPNPTSTTCKNNAGLSGTCISTSACKDKDGDSEAGHCPGAANIQCCTIPKDDPTPPTCKNNAGLSGTCISTSACSDKGGKSEAGHCPGAANIQCCTKDTSPPTTCKNNAGKSGTCISTSSCSTKGGKTEAGHCPGAANIQCCADDDDTSTTCTVNAGLKGKCQSTTSCASDGGVSEAGHCPGAANIQCCVKPIPCKLTTGKAGFCLSTDSCAEGKGKSTPGLCPGAADIQCCTYASCKRDTAERRSITPC